VREPRVWSKIDASPVLLDPPEALEVNGRRWRPVDQSGGRYYRPGCLPERTIQQLRELGDVTEVVERPHHACREPECTTPSGKIACHTCGESWPCSIELRKRSDA
jgi:hypothetical protein